jgi:nucleotide-binding universal stress UspA family protein
MDRILAATDGSDDAQNALRWAVGLAKATGAELLVVHTWTPRTSELPPDEFEQLHGEALTSVDAWAADARAAGVPYRTLAPEGDPREQILPVAATEQADLVVIGARGMSGHHHALHLGSVTHHLAHHADRPLAMIPPGSSTTWPQPMVVGLDGSDASLHALEWALALARDSGVGVTAVYAEHPPAEFVPHDDPDSWFQSATKSLEEWVAPYVDGDVPLERIVIDQSAGPGLAREVEERRAGLLVTGAHGKGGITGVRLGGTALKALHHSAGPVVIVP